METHFLPPGRNEGETLRRDISAAAQNPLIDTLLRVVQGLLAVLNEHRQIVALNENLLHQLGFSSPEEVLGARPGEAIRCVHAEEMPGGCGTSRYCSTCGAAVAIVTSFESGRPQERKCVARVRRNGRTLDICLEVRACPLRIDGAPFLLLFLRDITRQERWAALEQSFFHDINNLLAGLVGSVELLRMQAGNLPDERIERVQALTARLDRELNLQKSLASLELRELRSEMEDVSPEEALSCLRNDFADHPALRDRAIEFPEEVPRGPIRTDPHLLHRVLANMTLNALEATKPGGRIRVWVERNGGLNFCVWNDAVIPEEDGRRIFQRHYSTKSGSGRGTGTYAMKLIGEHYLGGRVGFTSSPGEGTVFRLTLPG